jgi:mitogen-activated protein kinase 15
MHEAGVCHRDVTPNNVRLSAEGIPKFFDFGISKIMVGVHHTKNCVTRCYRPPEIFFGDTNYTQKVDIWSLGCLLYEVVTGKTLFSGTSDLEVIC